MRLVVGRIGRAHGIRGEVSVELRTDEPDVRFATGAQLHTSSRSLTVASTRRHQGRLLVRFAGVPDRTAAEALQGTLLEVDVDPDVAPDDPEEFYDHQLIGLVVRSGGVDRGHVTDVVHGPEQDLLVVDVDGTEVLIPFVTELVPTIDVAGGLVEVADRPGLIDPDAADEVTS